MKLNTSSLIGPALDWAVAKCEGYSTIRCGAGPSQFLAYIPPNKRSHYKWRPSTSWTQGGPIVEREGLTIGKVCGSPNEWSAESFQDDGVRVKFLRYGPTPLVAAMRAFVASRLGDEVEIPKELL